MIALRSLKTAQRNALPAMGAVRHLNVHEYVSMEIMQAHGIKTPNCSVASTPEEAEQIFLHKLNKRKCVCTESVVSFASVRSSHNTVYSSIVATSRCTPQRHCH